MKQIEASLCLEHNIKFYYYCPECRPEFIPELSRFEYSLESKPTEYLVGRIARQNQCDPELVEAIYDYCRKRDISLALVIKRIKHEG
jgi:hypothetical protein